ncbi:hypothetical protein QAD02_015880 [Eretmocerus hayati]|uniref:Uncharacterized protein n=1 Tax=Eretmocerus hayati TaxID=131215 RepID=A0ACC2P9I6_9HYME|nr:hypothetical protein QAD02_015880 [Eretmocerus hayati]
MGRLSLVTLLASLALVSVVCAVSFKFLDKKYELYDTDENFDKIMKILDVSLIKRGFAKVAKPVVSLKEHYGVYTFTTKSAFKDHQITFRPNEEFNQETLDDRKNVKSVIRLEGNKMIETQYGNKVVTITREFSEDRLITTTEVDGITSVRKYKLIG